MTGNWGKHLRDLVYELYISENRPLKEVIGIIRTRTDFSAAERTYRTHLKKWGFSKKDAHGSGELRESSQQTTELISQGSRQASNHASFAPGKLSASEAHTSTENSIPNVACGVYPKMSSEDEVPGPRSSLVSVSSSEFGEFGGYFPDVTGPDLRTSGVIRVPNRSDAAMLPTPCMSHSEELVWQGMLDEGEAEVKRITILHSMSSLERYLVHDPVEDLRTLVN